MITFRRRRIIGSSAAALLAITLAVTFHKLHDRLIATATASGLLLFGFILFLAAYNGRKRLSFLPLGSSASWLQFHLYAGYVSIVLFLIHAGFQVPQGGLESLLSVIFGLVAASGVIGLYLSRRLPPRLSLRRGTIVFETIPQLRAALRDSAEKLALDSIESTGKTTIADFYVYKLAHFFIAPNNLLSHLNGSHRHLKQTFAAIDGVKRYLSAPELALLNSLTEKVREKDELDFQYSLQLVLKCWLFVHIPLTFSLLIIGFFHGIYASMFT